MHKIQIGICSVTWWPIGMALAGTWGHDCFEILAICLCMDFYRPGFGLSKGNHPTEHSRGYWYSWCFLLWVVQSPADTQLQQDSYSKGIWGDWRLASFPGVEKNLQFESASTKPMPIQSNFISTGEIKSRIMPRLSSKEQDVMKAGFTFRNPLRVLPQER